jgi:hypothetical protein
MNDWAAPVHGTQRPESTTLLALVQALTRQGHSEREVEAKVLELLEAGHAVLIGTFRGTPLSLLRVGLGVVSDGMV